MLLKIKDRFNIMNLLPTEGNFLTLKALRILREELSPSEEEIKEIELTQIEENIKWDTSKDKGKNIIFGDTTSNIIITALKELDKANKLTEDTLKIYEMFIPNFNLN